MYDELKPAESMKIESRVYFHSENTDISNLTSLPIERLQAMREESAAAEQAIFNKLREVTAEWEKQAGKTLSFDKAIDYVKTPPVKHTSNQWRVDEVNKDFNSISNMVYKMRYHVSENTRFDKTTGKSVPYAYDLTWSVRTNNPGHYSEKIAGQDKKRFANKADMEKYLAGRIKTYANLFTEISPPIPQEHVKNFRVNGQLLQGYTVQGEEPKQLERAAAFTAKPTEQTQTAAVITAKPTEQTQTAAAVTTKPTEQTQTTDAITTKPTVAAAPFMLVSDNPRDKLKEITEKLENGIKGIFESEQYKSYLNTLSKFHNYSLNNCVLIAMQKPDATYVAGFNAWRDTFKRPVKKGEKGMKILAPSPFKVKKEMDKIDPQTQRPIIGKDGKPLTEQVEVTVPAFTVVTVFDVSQTDGQPLPQIGVNELTGSVDKYKDFLVALEKTSNVPIDFEVIKSGAKGYYQQEEKRIVINEGMSELQSLKTAIHELAHSRLHDIDNNAPADATRPDRRTREVEAESIAYTVCQHYGLDTSDYSFGYVATWSGEKQLDTLKSSLDTIRKEADAIISEVDKHFREIQQNREQTADRQPGFENWSEPATPENAPDNSGAPSDDINAYLPKQDAPDLQKSKQGLGEEVKATLQFFIDSDIKDHGELRPATLEMIAVQGYEYHDGKLEEAPPVNGTFTIYQLKDGDETRYLRNEPLDSLKEAPDAANYNEVYHAPLKHGDTLDRLYLTFNLDKPEDFTGKALSMSDVVVMNRDGKETAYYIDRGGFKELPDFLIPKEPTRETPLPLIDLRAVADYMQKQYDTVQAADPNKTQGQAAFNMAVKRLEQTNEKITDRHPQLKALITHAAQSPDLPTLKERMNTMHSEFIQHYSTAVQNMIDTSGKAEPKAPAATVRQTDTPPAPKPPAQGENVAAIEAKVKAGETINLSDLSDAIKKDKQAAQTTPKTPVRTNTQSKTAAKTEQPSIKEKIAAGKQEIAALKSAPAKAAAQNKNKGLGD